jgi:CRISPR-associated protein Csm2
MATTPSNIRLSGQSRPNPGYRGNDDRGPRDAEATLDVTRIRFGEKIAATLYSDVAEATAKEVATQLGGRDVNKGTQLRRFYDELVMMQGKVGNSAEDFLAQEPYIQMIKAKVAYAMGRKKVDANFDKLLRHVIDEAKDHKSLAQAKLFMEAFMAFYKVHGPKD